MFAGVVGVVAIVAAACSSDGSNDASSDDDAQVDAERADDADDFVYPVPDWVEVDPESTGVDPEALQRIVDVAEGKGSHCLVVTRDGQIVGEWYWGDWDETTEQEVFSATKSFTSTLVGIAQDRGELDIDEPASKYIPEWVGTDSEDVTIRNLLSNDSGRFWEFAVDYFDMATGSQDKTAFAIDLDQQHDPGTFWEYNNSAIQTLEAVLETATGMDVGEYAQRYLFEPLGMASSLGRDRAGNPLTFSALSASCRDMARLGYLFLRDGRWADGEQVVSESWVEEATQPSTELNTAYGYLWWLNVDGHWVLPTLLMGRDEGDGKRVPGMPEEVFAAQGFGGQIIAVYPSTGVVMARIGPYDIDPKDLISKVFVSELERLGSEVVVDQEG